MNILVIPEDFRKDGYILEPLLQRLLSELGRPRSRVRILRDPLLGGVGEALKSSRIREIVDRNQGMVDIFLLCVDRDGIATRQQRLDDIEREFDGPVHFLATNAWEEIETWALAGLALPKNWQWRDIRTEANVKEAYFEPFSQLRGTIDGPGGGRKALGEEASRNIQAIRQKCPEDFDRLAKRIELLL